MSYTQFSAQASCEVVEGFNLDSFLDGLMKRCVQEDNFIAQEYGLDPDNEDFCDFDFHYYVNQTGKEIQIFLDTEENCNNSEVFDWLTQQFIPVMTSRYLRVDTVTMDSRDGNSCWIAFTDKNGNQITVDDLLRHYEAYGSLTQTDS